MKEEADSEVEADEEAEPDVPTWRNSEEERLLALAIPIRACTAEQSFSALK